MAKNIKLDGIENAIEQLKQGGMIIVVDDENRENEGDLICAASTITAEQVNFMARYGRGLICLSLPQKQINRLNLPRMAREEDKGDAFGTAFTLSVDAKEGITTGISAADRAHTIRLAADPSTKADQLCVPGHVFPLAAKVGGVLKRRGHTEAAVDLTNLAGLEPGGVICEIMKDDGTMMRLHDLMAFSKEHNLPLVSIKDLVQYRLDHEVHKVNETRMPTPYGVFRQRLYNDKQGKEHVVLWMGDIAQQKSPLVRIHSECLTGDIFGSLRCDCGEQLRKSFERIGHEGCGILIYLRQEGRGIGLTEKMKAYALQDKGLDTVEANLALGHPVDMRTYDIALRMLQDLQVHKIRLITNNPLKVDFLRQHGLDVHQVPLLIATSTDNEYYQRTKVEKLHHMIPIILMTKHGKQK